MPTLTRFESQVGIDNPDGLPEKSELLFRYDPAVLIIHIRWHETKTSFGKIVRDLLGLGYAGNEESVGLACFGAARALTVTPTGHACGATSQRQA